MKNMFDAVTDKFGPWVVAFAMIYIILFVTEKSSKRDREVTESLMDALNKNSDVVLAQTELFLRQGVILPPQAGPQPFPLTD